MQAPSKTHARKPLASILIAAAGYIRMSTDQQDASPARQRSEIEKLAEKQGYRIVVWYEDHGLTGTQSLNRPQFQKMLNDAKKGTFRAVLMYEQSRFSREDIFDAMPHWKRMRDAGVELVTCQRGKIDLNTLGGLITAIVDQHGAHDESLKLADRSVSGRVEKAKAGKRHHGQATYGFDRLIRDETGKEVRRVHFREKFQKPKAWTQEYAPSSDMESVDIVRWVFEQVAAGRNVNSLARELNKRKVRNRCGNTWTQCGLKDMLMNPVYAGILRAGKYSGGQFRRMDEEGLILVKDAHIGLITENLYYEVQDRLQVRQQVYESDDPGRYLLSGLVVCDHCGGRMYGQFNGNTISYACTSGPMKRRTQDDCPRPYVTAWRLETFVLDSIRDRLLCDDNHDRLVEAAQRWQSVKRLSFEQDQLSEVERKIERATENLAIADGEDFLAISKLLEKWRGEKAELNKRIHGTRPKGNVTPEALEAVALLTNVRDTLHDIDRVSMAAALKNTIREIRVHCQRSFKPRAQTLSGVVHFQPDVCPDGSLPFTHGDIGGKPLLWPKVAELIREAGEPLTAKQIAKGLGLSSDVPAYRHINHALEAGEIARGREKKGQFILADEAAEKPKSRPRFNASKPGIWNQIVDAIRKAGKPMTAEQLSSELGFKNLPSIYFHIRRAIDAGAVKRHPKQEGYFTLAR